MLLEGIFPPITTPFYPDGSLYLRKLEHNVALYSRTQLSGMVVLGSTGEAVMLSNEEQREVLAIAIAAASPEKVMIAGVGQESVRQTLALAEFAGSLNYDAVLVRTPHFYRRQLHRESGAQLEMLTYYRTVADNSPLPVLLYNVPFFTAYDMPVELIAELSHHPNIIGIKESSGNVDNVAAIVKATQFVKRIGDGYADLHRRHRTDAISPAFQFRCAVRHCRCVAAGKLRCCRRCSPREHEDAPERSWIYGVDR